jgi:hypothetical protein
MLPSLACDATLPWCQEPARPPLPMTVPLDRVSRALQEALELGASYSGLDEAARERWTAASEADARAIEMVARILASDEVRLLHERDPALRSAATVLLADVHRRPPTDALLDVAALTMGLSACSAPHGYPIHHQIAEMVLDRRSRREVRRIARENEPLPLRDQGMRPRAALALLLGAVAAMHTRPSGPTTAS